MPDPTVLPEPLRELAKSEAVEISATRFDHDIGRIVEAVRDGRSGRRLAPGVQRDLPVGTVTFLFTDVEGSTRLLD